MHAGRNPVDPRVAAPCINHQGRAPGCNRSSNRLTFPAGMSGSPKNAAHLYERRQLADFGSRSDRMESLECGVIGGSRINRVAIIAGNGENRLQERPQRSLKPSRILPSQFLANSTKRGSSPYRDGPPDAKTARRAALNPVRRFLSANRMHGRTEYRRAKILFPIPSIFRSLHRAREQGSVLLPFAAADQ